jgi:hypothetical protein
MHSAKGVLAVGLVLCSALAGLLGAPFWSFLLAGSGLALTAVWEQRMLRVRFAIVGANEILVVAHLASIANACFTAAAAWGVGMIFRLAVMSI